jgi:hypothetical protein
LDAEPWSIALAGSHLRELLGRIDLKREGKGELWAEYGMQPAALLKVVGALPD